MCRSPQSLIPSSPGTTSSGSKAPTAGRTWCAPTRNPLFLRRQAPRLPDPRRRRRAGRGAPLPAIPYSFVAKHHVFRVQGAGGGPDVVRHSPQSLIPSSPSTTSSGTKAPAAGRTWCATPRNPLFLRRRAPRLPEPRRRRRGDANNDAARREYLDHVGVARRWNMASRGARRQHGRLRGETNLKLGAKGTEDKALRGFVHQVPADPAPKRA